MKSASIRPCAVCGKGLLHAGHPMFFCVSIQRMVIDMREILRVSGTERMLAGNVPIARALYDPEIANALDEPTTVLLCMDCAVKSNACVAQLAETGAKT